MLADYFKGLESVLVAFSGGVDSSVLAKAAYECLGEDAVAVTFDTPTLPRSEMMEARETAEHIGIRHVVVRYTELSNEDFRRNPDERCYYCKRMMSEKLKEVARELGVHSIVEGTTADELEGHRPGYRALQEAGVLSPMAELGLTKDDVRRMALEYGLRHDKPSGACLSSRIPSGTEITEELLIKVEESEDFLRSLGLSQVRVRVEGDCARIETYRDDFPIVLEHAGEIVEELPFKRVSLDLRPYS
ncbi:MAG: ATP-dependent sacrificial sulfur transferase LarE [Candidatus Altiarchaeales archaeon]|nr:ATP-dependent sacrificial sulfur transferase LarE [Candidatus Altiarchaeales archaeon]MBD3416939.1 ATP-dependent sacrificial sulfur transferase LarE [Candidatus Altiarchaeales archaeon]